MTPSVPTRRAPRRCPLALAAGLLLAAGGVSAVMVPGVRPVTAASASTAAPGAAAAATTLDLARGRIEAVDAVAGTLTLRGSVLPLPLHPRLKLVSPAGDAVGGAHALQRGMSVRFAFETVAGAPAAAHARPASAATSTTEPAPRRIVLIYIESTP